MKEIITVKDVMSQEPISIDAGGSLHTVIQVMNVHKYNHIPVVDNEGRLLGMISKSDLYKKALSISQESSGKSYSKLLLSKTKASEVMTPNPISVMSNQSLEYATEILLQGVFHALPVVSGEKLIGI